MDAQEIISGIEREERRVIEHRQVKPRSLNLNVMKQMTTTQIKKAESFFKIQEDLDTADRNISNLFKKDNRYKVLNNYLEGLR